ncbi:MAG: glycosyltransferase [Bacteroidia bacterium]|nr:glycosyltransferase [Bacteroidia bacterium]
MKVLIVIPSFSNGGTITSLKNLVSQLDISKYKIDVFAITNSGPNREYIAKYTNVLGPSLNDEKIKPTIKVSLKRSIYKSVKSIKKGLEKIGIDVSPIIFKILVNKLEKFNYNLVIGFQEGQVTRFVSYFKSIRKVAWVRCDYSNMLRISGIKPQHILYSKIDKIVCVSEYTKAVFVNLLPETRNKTIALHNLISYNSIIKKSEETKELDPRFFFNGFKIVSLGRIDPVKRFSLIPEIVSKLKKRGLSFRWYILGGGETIEKQLLINNIKINNVEKELILLGEKTNPYPYIRESHLLVSTSLSEACPNVINEAKILGTPIVVADFGSVYEFIDDNVNGIVSPIETIADKVEIMITDKELYCLIKTNISNFRYNNDRILDVWYNKILVI